VVKFGVTADQLTDAWMKGGKAYQDLILGTGDIGETLRGEYLKRHRGMPSTVGKAKEVDGLGG